MAHQEEKIITSAPQKIGEDSEAYRDSIATVDERGRRIWLYPKQPKGRYYKARTWVSWVFIVFFLVTPFIKVHGDPLLLFNVLERRFIIFGAIFTPQDFVLFGLLMITFLVFIILFTLVYGRLFCGWVCPQTVFMEMIFRRIEYWIEGDASQQRKLDAAPWNTEKIQKKLFKHLIFFTIAVVVANYFLAYLIGMDKVLRIVGEPVSQHVGGFIAMLIFSGVFYFVFARLREQVCTSICPYGRMQGVLLIKESIVVAYDFVRGEPRGKLKKTKPVSSLVGKDPCACDNCTGDGECKANHRLRSLSFSDNMHAAMREGVTAEKSFALAAAAENKNQGDCIDCKLCIAVCPTGIDIRNGTQLECTNCTACIDACDEVMDKIGKPRGLIRYDSVEGIRTGNKKIFSTRVKAYSGVLLALLSVDIFLLASRDPVETIILRSPGQTYQVIDDAHLSNLYTYQIINKSTRGVPIELRLASPGGTVDFVGGIAPQWVKEDSLVQGAFFVTMEKSALHSRKTPIVLGIYSGGKKIDEVETIFMGPK